MRRSGLGIGALMIVCLVCGGARADEELDRLKADYDKAMDGWVAKFKALRDRGGENAEVDMSKLPPMPAKAYLPKFKAYAEAHAGKPEAVEALVQVIVLAGRSGGEPDKTNADADWAVGRLTREHAADESLADHIPHLIQSSWYIDPKALGGLYVAVCEKNPSRDAKASAKLGLALQRGTLNPMQTGELSAEDRAAALGLFREVVKDYDGTDAAKSAKGYVYELEHLQVGMKAPEIEGKAVDGTLIRLSQFRGQVVVLDFWGFW